MSQRKSRREQEKAMRHLVDYPAQQEEWVNLYEEFFDQMFSPLADRLSVALDEVQRLIHDFRKWLLRSGHCC